MKFDFSGLMRYRLAAGGGIKFCHGGVKAGLRLRRSRQGLFAGGRVLLYSASYTNQSRQQSASNSGVPHDDVEAVPAFPGMPTGTTRRSGTARPAHKTKLSLGVYPSYHTLPTDSPSRNVQTFAMATSLSVSASTLLVKVHEQKQADSPPYRPSHCTALPAPAG